MNTEEKRYTRCEVAQQLEISQDMLALALGLIQGLQGILQADAESFTETQIAVIEQEVLILEEYTAISRTPVQEQERKVSPQPGRRDYPERPPIHIREPMIPLVKKP